MTCDILQAPKWPIVAELCRFCDYYITSYIWLKLYSIYYSTCYSKTKTEVLFSSIFVVILYYKFTIGSTILYSYSWLDGHVIQSTFWLIYTQSASFGKLLPFPKTKTTGKLVLPGCKGFFPTNRSTSNLKKGNSERLRFKFAVQKCSVIAISLRIPETTLQ